MTAAPHLKDPGLLKTGLFINGRWEQGSERLAVTNPATGNIVAEIASAGAAETQRAIDAAAAALPGWRNTSALERSRILRRWFDLLVQHQDDLAAILTAEQGKPLAEARGEIAYGASYIEWFAEEAKRIDGDILVPPSNDKRLFVIRQPVGVVATITPWNFPNAMIARKVAPALAAGCTVVSKPAKETPLSALALAELGARAGLPAGVFNVVCGKSSSAIGDALLDSPVVRKLSFTGSTEIGMQLQARCAATMKRTSMELGGNAPFIVFDDADLDLAVAGAMASKFRNAGQTCVCSNRLLVQSGVYETFAAKLEAAVAKLKVGDGAADGTTIGPLINLSAVKSVQAMVDDAVKQGATASQPHAGGQHGANFVAPVVLRNAATGMRVFREEIFGPVAPLFRFDTEEQAVAMANDTDVGLAAYFYTRDPARIWRVGEALEYGIIGINEGLISNAMAPFGGIKASGHGREGSKYGLDDYLDIKYLCQGGLG